MQAHYRSDYPGEFVVLETRWSGGKKQQRREWIPNSIENQHISGRAACIGSDADFEQFDYTRLQRHRGGLLGSKKLQTYGNGSIAPKMKLDFTVENNVKKLETLIDTKYAEENVIYTSTKNCISHPGLFYLTPYNPRLCELALQPYLAAFDGHREVFLLGYTNDTPNQSVDWIVDVDQILTCYADVKFFIVGEPTNIPNLWLEHSNVNTMPYRDYIGYCDI
jgi:hypothetical protein